MRIFWDPNFGTKIWVMVMVMVKSLQLKHLTSCLAARLANSRLMFMWMLIVMVLMMVLLMVTVLMLMIDGDGDDQIPYH